MIGADLVIILTRLGNEGCKLGRVDTSGSAIVVIWSIKLAELIN